MTLTPTLLSPMYSAFFFPSPLFQNAGCHQYSVPYMYPVISHKCRRRKGDEEETSDCWEIPHGCVTILNSYVTSTHPFFALDWNQFFCLPATMNERTQGKGVIFQRELGHTKTKHCLMRHCAIMYYCMWIDRETLLTLLQWVACLCVSLSTCDINI